MTGRARERRKVSCLVLTLSAAAWILVLAKPWTTVCICACKVADSGSSTASFWTLLGANLVSSLAVGWSLMLVAMMLPTLIAPILHVMECSFKHRRIRSVILFALGYGLIWIAAGAVLLAARLGLTLAAAQSYWPAAAVALIAFVWQCTPIKQLCLNRNHNHRELAAFGMAADLDVFRFGLTHGIWCVGSCWALMLFPMLLSQGHHAAMAAVMFLMISESLERPQLLRWRLRGPGKLIRILVAQTRIRLQSLGFGSSSSSSAA